MVFSPNVFTTMPNSPAPVYPYPLPPLPYAYEALEPYLDAATLRLHHDQHHQAYLDKLNAALKDYPQLHQLSIEELLRQLDQVPEAIRATVRNQGGGHANHQFFWKVMAPGMADQRPTGELAALLDRDFGSFAGFQQAFETAGMQHFGAGWVFLAYNPQTQGLEVFARPNQDSVLLEGKPGLLANDVWEHAYYLQYQNRRAEYLAAWWQVVNWPYVAERLAGIRAGKKQL